MLSLSMAPSHFSLNKIEEFLKGWGGLQNTELLQYMEGKTLYLDLGVWLKIPGWVRPLFDEWSHHTHSFSAPIGPVLNWNQISFLCVGDTGGILDILSYPWEWPARKRTSRYNSSISGGNGAMNRRKGNVAEQLLCAYSRIFIIFLKQLCEIDRRIHLTYEVCACQHWLEI